MQILHVATWIAKKYIYALDVRNFVYSIKSWYTDLIVRETSSYDNHCGKNYSKVKLKEKKKELVQLDWTEV